MATFVLVHGAFLGGWAFKSVRPLLRAAGHDVFTPSLAGAGEHSHLLTPDIGLSTHIQEITNLLELEDLRDVVLLGHSYAGNVVTGVADRAPGRVAKLVYLDAQVPTHGRNAMGAFPDDTAGKLESASAGPRLLPPISLDAMGIFDPALRAWVEPRLVHHPMKCLEEPIHLQHGEPTVPRSYVYCTARESLVAFFNSDPLGGFVEKARREGFKFYDIPSGHSPMLSHPRELAEILLAIAG
jgi:pimeloyl-ACP methyl ester carboxylesterase